MEISILGNNYNDTVLYLVQILKYLGRKVLVRDMTKSHVLCECITYVAGIDPNRDVLDYAGIGYTWSLGDDTEYDLTLRLCDSDMIPFVNGAVIIVTDESKKSAEELEKLRWQEFCSNRNKCLIVKNYTGIIKNQFDTLIKTAEITSVYTIPIDVKNFKSAVMAEYKEKYLFESISRYYKEALAGAIKMILPEFGIKEIDVAISLAAGGKKR